MTVHVRILAGRLDREAGSHVYHNQIARRLAARGYRVSVVCFASEPEVARCAEVIEVPRRSYEDSHLWRGAAPLQYMQCTRDLLLANPVRPDIVVGGEHLFLRGHQRAFPDVPWIYLPHSLVIDNEIRSYGFPPLMNWISTRTYVWLQRWSLEHANCTLRFTREACEILQSRYPDLKPHFFVNPMGVDLPERRERPARAGRIELLSVGRLVPSKRVDVALRALAKLRDYDWHLSVVGEGRERPALENQVSEMGLSDRVTFYGFQRDPSSWYRKADLLLLPSCLENFPIVIVEAMSHQVPCLAMRADGKSFHNANAEIIQDEKDGFLAESDFDFEFRLCNLVSGDPARLRRCGEAARRAVECNYTWDRHLDRCEELIASLL